MVLEEIRDSSGDVKVDALGNVLFTSIGRGRRRQRVMVDAHMDEVGFMIVAEDGDGLYEFTTIGGLDARGLPGRQVVVGGRHVQGVIGTKPIHLMKEGDLKKTIELDSLRIDLGPGGKVEIGARGTFAPNFMRVGPSVMSKALDNRLGVAILLALVQEAQPNMDLLAAFTVQEEVGLRGAQVAAKYFDPDLAIVVDATPARDLPVRHEGDNTFYNSRLGLGPAIYVSNRTAIDDPRLVRHMISTAERARIPHQIRQPGTGGTDAGAIQMALEGVPVVSVSVPNRHPHTAMSVARIEDWRNTHALISAALHRLTPRVLKQSI